MPEFRKFPLPGRVNGPSNRQPGEREKSNRLMQRCWAEDTEGSLIGIFRLANWLGSKADEPIYAAKMSIGGNTFWIRISCP